MAGFTLVEMIMVIVITGIIGGMVAVFMRAPVQQYVDVARRADMTDTADTALRRISRDVRLALPNSVRVRNNGGTVFMEFLETIAGGRYNSATIPADCLAFGNCTGLTTLGNLEDGTAGTTSLNLPDGNVIPAGARVVVYNQYNNSGLDCNSANPSVYCAAASGGAPVITSIVNGTDVNEDQINFGGLGGHTFFPAGGSPQNRFQIVTQPVTYACTGGTLVRYWGYNIQPIQPNSINASNQLLNSGGAVLANQLRAVLANIVGATCNFTYAAAVAQRNGLVTMNLSITRDGETVTLYNATHVSNQQ